MTFFIWKMAWRDSRSSRRRLLLFSISITLGIAALVGIGSFRHSLAQAIDDQARSLIGADLVVECAGVPAAVSEALELVRPGGRVLVLGQYTDHGPTPLNPHRVPVPRFPGPCVTTAMSAPST